MGKSTYLNWGEHFVKLTWIPTNVIPYTNKVTSVHGVCFCEDKVMLVRVKNRGFNLPGGHVEQRETFIEALQRECYEEGYIQCTNFKLIGMMEVNHNENPHYDKNGKYPLIGYQLFYRCNVIKRLPFKREFESITRIWVEPEEVSNVIDDHELINLVLLEAIKQQYA